VQSIIGMAFIITGLSRESEKFAGVGSMAKTLE